MISVRRRLLEEMDRSIAHAGLVLEKPTFEKISAGTEVVVVAFGLLCYFSEEQVT
ncbi:MAG TPA: hypothetical protein PLG50_04480 [bacterium]|nr:hypothetical protein [bacterium]HQG44893.1 hypothetical protein [bacterium]HQI50065.1 hypothetical protein [bacterium]HQJ63705.1 hypothetical protein [bacterium]